MRKKTKIVATISDMCCDVDFIKQLYDAGMDVVRLNTAHQSPEDTLKVINVVRAVSDKIPLLLDTKGPEIRTMPQSAPVPLKKGDTVYFTGEASVEGEFHPIYVNYPFFVRDIPTGTHILVDDGEMDFVVTSKDDKKLTCTVMNDGAIKGRKSINVPGIHIDLPSLTQKDIDFIYFAIENNLDFIAHSFVRTKEDVLAVQRILDEKNSSIKIIAKIEDQQGVDNIEEILDHAYGVMVARGDMGIEIAAEKIPTIQKMIIRACNVRRKPVIVATQMLHTMISAPRATRAEVSDVANAIYDGTDAVMLSGETAYGQYPLEAVKTMARIAGEVENRRHGVTKNITPEGPNDVTTFLSRTAVEAAFTLPVKAIIADSLTGKTIKYIAAFRSPCPIFAMLYDKSIMRQLALSYGVYAYYMQPRETTDELMIGIYNMLSSVESLDKDDMVTVMAGNFVTGTGSSFVELTTFAKLQVRRDHILKDGVVA